MKVLTKNDNVIIAISNTAEDTGEPTRNIILDNYAIAYAPNEKPNIYDIEEIPAEVEEQKYCYTEADGFTLNPNYVEPPKPTEERLAQLEQDGLDRDMAIAELAEMIIGGNE